MLSPTTKIEDVLDKYPFLENVLPKISPQYERLKSPEERKKIARITSLEVMAAMGGLNVSELIAILHREIHNYSTGNSVKEENNEELIKSKEETDTSFEETMEEINKVAPTTSDPIKVTIDPQFQGEPPLEEIPRLVEPEASPTSENEIIVNELKEMEPPETSEEHPINVFMLENREAESIISDLLSLIFVLGNSPTEELIQKHKPQLFDLLNKLDNISFHFNRKETLLFPSLNEKSVSTFINGMIDIHKTILQKIHGSKEKIIQNNFVNVITEIKSLIKMLGTLIYNEEHVLFPYLFKVFDLQTWDNIKEKSETIGFSWIDPPRGWIKQDIKWDSTEISEKVDLLSLNTGQLTLDQVNLILTHLPVDITVVDEYDKIVYFSQGKNRLFPLTPDLIGRKLQECLPPKNVEIIENILTSFREGTRDHADFWVQKDELFIYTKYVALRTPSGDYNGYMEISQEISTLKLLQGEKRLYDWK